MLPCVQIEPADPAALASALARLGTDDVLVLTSRAGIDAVASVVALPEIPCPIAVVGAASAARLEEHGRAADFVPGVASGAALGRELPLPPGEVVLLRSDRALRDLTEMLHRRGARVREVVAYQTRAVARGDIAAAREALRLGATVVLASPSALEGLVAAVGVATLAGARFVAIGPTTSRAVIRRLGVEAPVARVPTSEAIAELLMEEHVVADR
jgi:uroporphyrinogen-III synthase